MSTRSNIAIKVKPSDYDMVSEKIGVEVNDNMPYLQIYSHADGYPEHMMVELETNFNNYEAALAVILEGDTSGIYKGESRAYTNYGESYKETKPCVVKYPVCNEEYLYTFENDKWYNNADEDE